MPILQYHCKNCGENFEELVKKFDDEVFCPVCKEKAERTYCGTVYSATGKPVKKCSGNCKNCGGC
ncbi:MAG: zinc ribbon domain-containing protein [Clostridia bacterium]|jgi:putative FmdB family regulatory protein|nr:zinc ribbon domain-containing protein [Clostridia bacterium]